LIIISHFRKIWEWFKARKDILTPFDYKKGVEEAFKESTLQPEVIDVFVIPEFSKFIYDSVDNFLSHLHTLDFTQLQWIFEECTPDIYFPYGVKTTYRRYSSDRVCEIREQAPNQCTTIIGQQTGLEPYAVCVEIFPNNKTFDDRPVEGFSLLTKLPCSGRTPWLPSLFAENTKKVFDKVYSGVMNFFAVGSIARNEWVQWLTKIAPRTDDVFEYLDQHHEMKKPLEFYFNLNNPITWSSAQSSVYVHSAVDELVANDWEFPNMNIAIAQASVVTRFNPHPPEPLAFFNNSNNIVAKFTEICQSYNTRVLEKMVADGIKDILRCTFLY
jgi:hypothetical protein